MNQTDDIPPPDAAQLHPALARLLRPMVRLLIRCGVTLPALSDLMRELYVNVAEHDFALSEKEQTDSRVSLLTGLHRKEVRRLRGAGAPVRTAPVAVSRTSQIVALWLASPEFTDARGTPLPLARRPGEDSGPTFEALVEQVTRDVRPRAILDEWIDRKLVVLDSEGRVVLTEAGVAPRPGDERQLYYFGRNVHDHLAAATANLAANPPPFLERAVHYEGLSKGAAEHLERRSRDIAMEALIAMNREAQAVFAADEGGDSRWNFGVYVYREEAPPPSATSPDEETGEL